MKKTMFMLAALWLQWSAITYANAGSDAVDKFSELLQTKNALADEVCADAGEIAIAAATTRYSWTCWAKDSCGKPKGRGSEGCGKCKQHAKDEAIAACKLISDDPKTCDVVECQENY
jgi:hypothetical protein